MMCATSGMLVHCPEHTHTHMPRIPASTFAYPFQFRLNTVLCRFAPPYRENPKSETNKNGKKTFSMIWRSACGFAEVIKISFIFFPPPPPCTFVCAGSTVWCADHYYYYYVLLRAQASKLCATLAPGFWYISKYIRVCNVHQFRNTLFG